MCKLDLHLSFSEVVWDTLLVLWIVRLASKLYSSGWHVLHLGVRSQVWERLAKTGRPNNIPKSGTKNVLPLWTVCCRTPLIPSRVYTRNSLWSFQIADFLPSREKIVLFLFERFKLVWQWVTFIKYKMQCAYIDVLHTYEYKYFSAYNYNKVALFFLWKTPFPDCKDIMGQNSSLYVGMSLLFLHFPRFDSRARIDIPCTSHCKGFCLLTFRPKNNIMEILTHSH